MENNIEKERKEERGKKNINEVTRERKLGKKMGKNIDTKSLLPKRYINAEDKMQKKKNHPSLFY